MWTHYDTGSSHWQLKENTFKSQAYTHRETEVTRIGEVSTENRAAGLWYKVADGGAETEKLNASMRGMLGDGVLELGLLKEQTMASPIWRWVAVWNDMLILLFMMILLCSVYTFNIICVCVYMYIYNAYTYTQSHTDTHTHNMHTCLLNKKCQRPLFKNPASNKWGRVLRK